MKSINLRGGLVQLIRGKHVGSIFKHISDPLGGWTTQSLKLKNNKIFSIILAYRPCNHPVKAGTLTVVTQQSLICNNKNIYTHPRKKFLQDLCVYILDLQLEEHELLIGTDGNLKKTDKDFENFMDNSHLVDIINTLIEGTPTATHKKGNRLNILLGTEYILQFIHSTGSLSSDDGAELDHTACYPDLLLSIFAKSLIQLHHI